MKIEHFNHLKKELDQYLADNPDTLGHYARGEYPGAERTRNPQRRFFFDLIYLAGLSHFVRHEIWPYANDNHLFASLEKILPRIDPPPAHLLHIHWVDEDQLVTCPKDGGPTDFEEQTGWQRHKCLHCGYRFLTEFDNEDEDHE